MSGRRFCVITVLLVLMILFCVKGTVMSKGDRRRAEENFYYLTLEQEFVKHTREYLREQGFDDCGVMMTRVTYEDGSREYLVRVHHRQLERMTGEAREALKKELSGAEFGRDVCIFRYDL